jgi:hypothetical protein
MKFAQRTLVAAPPASPPVIIVPSTPAPPPPPAVSAIPTAQVPSAEGAKSSGTMSVADLPPAKKSGTRRQHHHKR